MVRTTNYIFSIGTIVTLLGNVSCGDPKTAPGTALPVETTVVEKKVPEKNVPAVETIKNPADFLPQGYVLFEEVYGDLNNDGLQDCAIIIKGTDKNNIVKDEYRGELDRNRRGIIILLNKNNSYEVAVRNYDCFSSENEDGGVYYAPELSVSINENRLYIEYSHGRYGSWKYTFRLQNSDLVLIGYDVSECSGPVINTQASINFLTKKKITKTNTNEDAEGEDEIFVTTETRIKTENLAKLSEIKDFDGLHFSGE